MSLEEPAEKEHPRDIQSGLSVVPGRRALEQSQIVFYHIDYKVKIYDSMNVKNGKEYRICVQTSAQKETHFHHTFD